MPDLIREVIPPLFGLVLAGGRSRRFGSDKAAIEVGGRSLLARTVDLLQGVTDRVFVSVRADQVADELRSEFSLIVDDEPHFGPAGGLLAVYGSATFITDEANIPALREVRSVRLGNVDPPPCNTLLVVKRLAEPEFQIEIEVVAAVPLD